MKLSAFVLAATFLTGCSPSPEYEKAPDVDWSGVRPAERTAIENGVRNHDCALLGAYNKTETNAEVLYYLDWALRTAGC